MRREREGEGERGGGREGERGSDVLPRIKWLPRQ